MPKDAAAAVATRKFWRVGAGDHPLWSGEGARLFGARWNRPNHAAIYAGSSCAICVLELLAHANSKAPPPSTRFLTASTPADMSAEIFHPQRHPGWDDLDDSSVARTFGTRWLIEQRSCVLIVPSVVTRGEDMNAVINPAHPDFARITVTAESPLAFDKRLFG